MKYRNHSITNVGKVRKANEDNYGDTMTPNGHLFVVCDGMGGHVGGAKASSIAVSSIIEYFMRQEFSNVIQAIDRSLSFANEQIFANALSDPTLKGMGTTAVVLIISGDDCYVGHVGDSRIYLKSDNKLNRITKDHSFVQTLVDSGVISDDEAESHPNKNQILKALGTSSAVEGTISQKAIKVKAGDVFLLCSDGLNGMVNDKGLEMMLEGDKLELSGDNLIRAALDAGGTDNITATIVAIDESVYEKSTFVEFNPVKKFNAANTQSYAIPSKPTKGGKKSRFSMINITLAATFVALLVGIGYFFFGGEPGKDRKKPTVETKVTEGTNLPTTVNNEGTTATTEDTPENKVVKTEPVVVKISKWPFAYTVIKNDKLEKIVTYFNKNYKLKLTVEKLKKYNNSKLKGTDSTNLVKDIINPGLILMIPDK
jgi:serine/threonine protein phosphatase PrpC